MRSLLRIASFAALCLCPANAWAGLIFELDGIDGRHISAAELGDDHLTVTARGRASTIQFPRGAGAYLLDWARADTGGPLVFSIDGSLVSMDGDKYWPPSVPGGLAGLLFSYDNFAHEVACGATPASQPEAHPLVRLAGEGMLPYRRHEALLDASTRTPQAHSYRRLTERFVSPLACIGELSLYAIPGADGSPVSIQPRSWIHMLSQQWYRAIDVPSEADRWVARLPYQPLKQDLEGRWTAYRSAFPQLHSLSSIVEAMALLRAIKHGAPSLWTTLERNTSLEWAFLHGRPDELEFHPLDREQWRQLTHTWIGDQLETPSEVNLALGLALAGDPHEMVDGIDTVVARDPLTGAKLELARLLYGDIQLSVEASRLIFEMLAKIPRSFRLRATALFGIEAKARREGLLEPGETLPRFLQDQKDALKNDFLNRAESACTSASDDLVAWESLSQDVYSVRLLGHFRDYDGRLPRRIVAAVACIHFYRGMAPQQGRELAYRHAHYRFLKYLARQTDDPQTRSQILGYRRKLARTMNLRDSDLGEQVQL